MTRFLLIAAAAAAVAVVAVPALAAPPEKIDYPFGDVEFAAGAVCPFPVSMRLVDQRGQAKLFFDRDATVTRLQWSGTGLWTIRNEITGTEVTIRSAGMGRVPLGPGGFDEPYTQIGAGRSLFWLFPGEPGGPGLFLTGGRFAATFLPGDVVTSFHATGPRTDLCAEVAGSA